MLAKEKKQQLVQFESKGSMADGNIYAKLKEARGSVSFYSIRGYFATHLCCFES